MTDEKKKFKLNLDLFLTMVKSLRVLWGIIAALLSYAAYDTGSKYFEEEPAGCDPIVKEVVKYKEIPVIVEVCKDTAKEEIKDHEGRVH